jgi:hypothetical protein
VTLGIAAMVILRDHVLRARLTAAEREARPAARLQRRRAPVVSQV